MSDNSTHSVTLLTSYAQEKRRDAKDMQDGKDKGEADEIRPPKSVTDSLSKYSHDPNTGLSRYSDGKNKSDVVFKPRSANRTLNYSGAQIPNI